MGTWRPWNDGEAAEATLMKSRTRRRSVGICSRFCANKTGAGAQRGGMDVGRFLSGDGRGVIWKGWAESAREREEERCPYDEEDDV